MFVAPAPAVPYYDAPAAAAVAAVPYYEEPAAVVEVAAPAGRVVDSHSDRINLGSVHSAVIRSPFTCTTKWPTFFFLNFFDLYTEELISDW